MGGGRSPMSGGGGLAPGSIKSTEDFLEAGAVGTAVGDSFVRVGTDMTKEYGLDSNLQVAELKGRAKNSVLAYYDGKNVAVNSSFMDNDKLETAYAACVSSGYHPSNGNKTAAEAVAAHEYGHAIAHKVGQKTGVGSVDAASSMVLKEAVKSSKHRSQSAFAKAISGYATTSAAETIAEAVADCYCNGNKAKAESKLINQTLKKYI